MIKSETFNSNLNLLENYNKREKIISNVLSQLEKDIFILINYIRTNPIDFAKNLISKNRYLTQNQEQDEIINYLEELYNKEKLEPFIEMPEISKAAGNLLYNIALNDKKFHNINLKDLKPSILNLRTRLSNYGHRTGRIFETVVFKTDNPEDIINHILKDEKGRNMLLSNRMKYIGIACDLLPSKIACSVIDIVQDFIPYRNKEEEIYSGGNPVKLKYNYNKYEINGESNDMDNTNYEDNINKLKFDIIEKPIKKNNSNMKIIINNNNGKYSSNLIFNKFDNERKNNNLYYNNNDYNNTPKKFDSMGSIPPEKNSFFSPKSVNSYNIIINNKIVPTKNKLNNINLINKENINPCQPEIDKKNIFTMAGRTSQEQQEILDISSKLNLNKSKSVCSFDFNSNASRITIKNKFQRLNQKEKLEILHKINQRNKNQKSLSTNNKALESMKSINLISTNNNNFYNSDISFDEKNKTSEFNNFDYYGEQSTSNRLNTFLSKINDSNTVNYNNLNGTSPLIPSYIESNNIDEYSRNKINEIKNDLLLIKNQIKKELKDEVKNEIKEEIKYEFNMSQNKNNKRPSSIKVEEEFDIDKILNNKRNKNKENNIQNNKIKLVDDEIYFKKNNSNYYNKNKIKNRCSSEERFIYTKIKNNIGMSYNNKYLQKQRATYEPNSLINNNNEENEIKDKNKEKYDESEDFPTNTQNNRSAFKNYRIRVKKISSDCKNNSYFNEEPKLKNRQQIKKLIRLYNIAKESKRTQNNEEIIYDIINNNKSISNLFLHKNKNNEKGDINKEHFNTKIDNISKKEAMTRNIFYKNKMYPMKYEKVKPIGNFHKFYIKNNRLNDKDSLKGGKNNINENNMKENDYFFTKKENEKNENEGKIGRNSKNEVFTLTGKFIDINNQSKNDIKNNNKEMIIKTYKDKNIISKENNKDEKENINKNNINNKAEEENLSITDDKIDNEYYDTNKYETLNNLNNSINNNTQNNDDKLRSPNQEKKEYSFEINDYDFKSDKTNTNNNNSSDKQQIYIPYQYFSFNKKNLGSN